MNLTPRYTEEDLERSKQHGRDEVEQWARKEWKRGYDYAIKQGSELAALHAHRGFWWGFAAGAFIATVVVVAWSAGGVR